MDLMNLKYVRVFVIATNYVRVCLRNYNKKCMAYTKLFIITYTGKIVDFKRKEICTNFAPDQQTEFPLGP